MRKNVVVKGIGEVQYHTINWFLLVLILGSCYKRINLSLTSVVLASVDMIMMVRYGNDWTTQRIMSIAKS